MRRQPINIDALSPVQFEIVAAAIESDRVYQRNLASIQRRVRQGKVNIALAGRIIRSLIEKAAVRARRKGRL